MSSDSSVRITTENLVIPTYLPAAPDKNPMFFENRVYQGSSGAVYPLPFIDRIAESKTDRAWRAVWIENEYLRVLVLPELGGRIHAIQDKTNGYDLIYRQDVIKPALIGLAGPWASGGIEFNWPQHHRPATFMPVDVHLEEGDDGARTVWCSDHDPLQRMKGMHGVRLRPGVASVELRVRAHNRTTLPQTFLWWANVATRVHENYQSFFPPDAGAVADHAKRATSAYPLCTGRYYGVDYGARARHGVPPNERPSRYIPSHCGGRTAIDYAPNDLSFYANIPVPTSYMCLGTGEDFFGAYDHAAQAGIVHLANHHIAPGKKQWTWGNHDFGYARDRSLTDPDARGECAPYIEIMAGVYTDNQPDFSFLQPGETKTWSQFWYPIQRIGVAHHANETAALHLSPHGRTCRIGVAVTRPIPGAKIQLTRGDKVLATFASDLAPGAPCVENVALPRAMPATALTLTLREPSGREIIRYTPKPAVRAEPPAAATEPGAPGTIASADELWLIGTHLEQYRHATRCPTLYWREALRRDPGDSRCHHALGCWHLRRGELALAESHLRRALARLTSRNPNPPDGEPSYHLGLCLVHQADAAPTPDPAKLEAAYAAFYKATWNLNAASAAYHALAEIDCRRGAWPLAREHLERSLRWNAENLRARDLHVIVLRRLDKPAEADAFLAATLAMDPLDWWARHLRGDRLACDAQTRLDLAHDCARAGLWEQALDLLGEGENEAGTGQPTASWGAAPLVHYTVAWLHERRGDVRAAKRARAKAKAASPDYCFPARLEDIAVLESAIRADARDARAPFYLGHLLYARRRHREAIACWEKAARLEPANAIAWRNLGLGYFNVLRRPAAARAAYARAVKCAPGDARILHEQDQLAKRLGESPARRLRRLEEKRALIERRDDLSLEYCALLNHVGRHEEARAFLQRRNFQTWEGGEGQVIAQHARTHLALGRAALARGDAGAARALFAAALETPENLGEARHLFANQSDLRYWLGCALEALGEREAARREWRRAASYTGDFQEMSVQAFSELTRFCGLAWLRLGQPRKARKLFRDLLAHARRLARDSGDIGFFVTSLPTDVLRDDVAARRRTTALLLEAQARFGLGEKARARALLRTVLRRDPGHAAARDLAAELAQT
jgi:tetratricopeptide (TPR) repeat protein